MTKDQLQHHLISVQQVPDSVQQADRDSGLQAARADHARDALFSVVKCAVFARKKTLPSITKSLVHSAFLLRSAAK